MPAILERLVNQLQAKGYDKSAAYAIGTSALNKAGDLKGGKATKKGRKRGEMTPAQRAKDRAVKYRGGQMSDYSYDSSTNMARKKKKKKQA